MIITKSHLLRSFYHQSQYIISFNFVLSNGPFPAVDTVKHREQGHPSSTSIT